MKIPQKYDKLIFDGYEELLSTGVPITEIAKVLNERWGTEFAESSMRGRYTQQKLAYDLKVDEHEYQEQLFNIASNRLRLVEERKILNKMRGIVDGQARELGEYRAVAMSIVEMWHKTPAIKAVDRVYIPSQHKSHIYPFGDVHWGYMCQLATNTYNPEEASARISELFDFVVQDVKENGYKEIVIADLGDQIEGASLRISQLVRISDGMAEQAKQYSELLIAKLKWISKELPDVKIKFAQVSSDNHAQLRLFSTKRDELDENLAILITSAIKQVIDTAHEFEKMTNLEYIFGDEIILQFGDMKNPYNVLLIHGHQYSRKDNILEDVELRHGMDIHLVIIAHWHQFKIVYKNLKKGTQTALLFLPSVVGDTDFAEKIHVSAIPGFCKVTLDLVHRFPNAEMIRL